MIKSGEYADFLIAPAQECGETSEQQFWYFTLRAIWGQASNSSLSDICINMLGKDIKKAEDWYANKYGEIDHLCLEHNLGSKKGIQDKWNGNDVPNQKEDDDWLNNSDRINMAKLAFKRFNDMKYFRQLAANTEEKARAQAISSVWTIEPRLAFFEIPNSKSSTKKLGSYSINFTHYSEWLDSFLDAMSQAPKPPVTTPSTSIATSNQKLQSPQDHPKQLPHTTNSAHPITVKVKPIQISKSPKGPPPIHSSPPSSSSLPSTSIPINPNKLNTQNFPSLNDKSIYNPTPITTNSTPTLTIKKWPPPTITADTARTRHSKTKRSDIDKQNNKNDITTSINLPQTPHKHPPLLCPPFPNNNNISQSSHDFQLPKHPTLINSPVDVRHISN